MDIPTQILTNKVLELVSKLVVHSSINQFLSYLILSLPFEVSKKTGVIKLAFIYIKRAKAKNNVNRTLGFPEYGMTNADNFK